MKKMTQEQLDEMLEIILKDIEIFLKHRDKEDAEEIFKDGLMFSLTYCGLKEKEATKLAEEIFNRTLEDKSIEDLFIK